MSWVRRDEFNFSRDPLDHRFHFKWEGSDSNVPRTSTPHVELHSSWRFTGRGPIIDYDGKLDEDVDAFAKSTYTAARVGFRLPFYIAAAALFTITDQLHILFSEDTAY